MAVWSSIVRDPITGSSALQKVDLEFFPDWVYDVAMIAGKTIKVTVSVLAAIAVLPSLVSCAHRLDSGAMGVDPAGGQSGGLPVKFVNPPYRAQDKISVTGQAPLPRPYPQRYSGGTGSGLDHQGSHRFPK